MNKLKLILASFMLAFRSTQAADHKQQVYSSFVYPTETSKQLKYRQVLRTLTKGFCNKQHFSNILFFFSHITVNLYAHTDTIYLHPFRFQDLHIQNIMAHNSITTSFTKLVYMNILHLVKYISSAGRNSSEHLPVNEQVSWHRFF